MRIKIQILPTVIGLTVAAFIWFGGFASIKLAPDDRKSVTDSGINETASDITKLNPVPLNASATSPKPPSAEKIQQQLDNQAQLAQQTELIDQKITELNLTLETLDQQLEAQGVQLPVARTVTARAVIGATSDTGDESTLQRIEAIRAHLQNSANE